MTGEFRLYTMGGLISLASHALLLAAIFFAIQPQPFNQQPMPEAQLEITSLDVQRSAAAAVEPEAPMAKGASAAGPSVAEATVPITAATEAVPAAAPAKEIGPPPRLAASVPMSGVAGPASLPTYQALLADLKPVAMRETAAKGEAAQDLPLAFQQSLQLPADSSRATVRTLPAESGLERDPAPQRIDHDDAEGEIAGLILPASEKAISSLAWSGDGALDPLSLTAITAFMQPASLAQTGTETGDLRDSLGTLLSSVPCGRVQATFRPETGTLELRGHVPDSALREPLMAALRAQIGSAIPVSDQLSVLPPPQCGVLEGMAGVGLPQSDEQLYNPRVIGANGQAREYRFTDGERLVLEVTAPDYPAVIYVDYFDAAGNVIHLQPNETVPLRLVAPKSLVPIGKGSRDYPSLDITIGPPFGLEIAVAFATSVPLYEGTRPIMEPAAPYLAELRALVENRLSDARGFKGEWVYFFVSTSPD